MDPRGFEPPTPGLRVRYSDQAELRVHIKTICSRHIEIWASRESMPIKELVNIHFKRFCYSLNSKPIII